MGAMLCVPTVELCAKIVLRKLFGSFYKIFKISIFRFYAHIEFLNLLQVWNPCTQSN